MPAILIGGVPVTIVIAILGAVAAAFWAFTHFVNAAQEGREALRDAKGVVRRGKWNRRVDQRLIENLSDPREAGAILAFQIAQYDGAVTDRQRDAMIAHMRETFQADAETADGLFAFARMAVGEVNDAGNSVRKILRPSSMSARRTKRASWLRSWSAWPKSKAGRMKCSAA